ncbi:hypothetical protein [Winogradskyella aurantia]|uniref:hypothetical protein n=1 Tax=Winogradskyella aurantia TaxID=1915063 RepID=UPI001055C080|nr:hypothetical protein [Winogradskyella aurantia]
MVTTKHCTFLFFIWLTIIGFAQRKDLKGQLLANDDIEGIHILNKTASKYTISEEDGSFIISAQPRDTLFISGLKYEVVDVVITEEMMLKGTLSVQLTEKINQLDQVIIGKLLTGSLESDLQNSDNKTDINFYDLGIPGSTKLPMTQNERKLHDADAGPVAAIMGGPFGGGVGLNFHKILNSISGRTKKLKTIVELDTKDKCINRLRREYEGIIFENNTLTHNLRNEYFLFAQEDQDFLAICSRKNDIEAIDFLKSKLKDYYTIKASTKE